jgi:hypothetical protein
MNTQLNVMKQALTALEQGLGHLAQDILRTAIEAAQTAPVPVRPAAPFCVKCGAELGALHVAAGDLDCGWPARVQLSDCTAPVPVQESVAWTGCGECDCSFSCHEGVTGCIRSVALECASPSLTSGERTALDSPPVCAESHPRPQHSGNSLG